MAGITTAVRLNDQMTAPLRNITNAVNMMLSSWESLDSATAGGLDMGDVGAIRTQLHEATTALDQLGNEQQEFNNKVERGSDALSGMTGKIAGMVAGYLSLLDVLNIVKNGIDYASDLAEVQNVVDVSFGKSAASINDWSQKALEAYGLNEVTAKRYNGTLGAMLKSTGVAGDSVVDMSEKLTGLAGDMASFYNLDTNVAFEKIRSGISGETEPLKQLGINMSVANLEAYALSQGITTAYDKMSQAEQTMLRYNYLMSVTSDAQGDFARTSDSWANQTRLLSENWTEFVGNMAANLLLSTDPHQAERLARELCALNRERQSVEQAIYAQAVEQIEQSPAQERSALVLASDTWHQGVVGIVASRLSEKYACPSFMIHLSGGTGKGSCRSWGGFNLFAALESCSDLLLDFGGHELAAGFTIEEKNIPAFRQRMNQYARKFRGGKAPVSCLQVDVSIGQAGRVTLSEVEALDALDRVETAPEEYPDRALCMEICGLVRRRLENPGYLRDPDYGAGLMDVFHRCRRELPIGYAGFHLPWVLEPITSRHSSISRTRPSRAARSQPCRR